jgi:hypothetical protein
LHLFDYVKIKLNFSCFNFYSISFFVIIFITIITIFTYLIILRSRLLLKKQTGSHPVKKFPAFCENRCFITPFTSANHLSLSRAKCQSRSEALCGNIYGEELLAPRPNPKLENHTLSAVRDCIFNIFAAILRIGCRSSIRNLRTRHTMVTGTHLSCITALKSTN